MNGLPPVDHGLTQDPLDYSREHIIGCAERAQSYAMMIVELVRMRDDVGANYMRARLATEVQGIDQGFGLIAKYSKANDNPAKASFERMQSQEKANAS